MISTVSSAQSEKIRLGLIGLFGLIGIVFDNVRLVAIRAVIGSIMVSAVFMIIIGRSGRFVHDDGFTGVLPFLTVLSLRSGRVVRVVRLNPRLTYRLLLRMRIDNAVVMLGMLEIILGRDPVPLSGRIPRQSQILFIDLMRVSANPHIRPIAVERLVAQRNMLLVSVTAL